MQETIKIPKFRTVRRLVMWMERNWHRIGWHRLPREREQVFFTTKGESPENVASCLARYSHWSGKLESDLEELLKPHRDSVLDYIRVVVGMEQEASESLMLSLSGDSRNLYRLGKVVGRLPQTLEDTISEPKFAFLYAKEVLCGRLPRHLEDVFFKDAYFAAKYAFEVIRGFSPVRLPDELHAFMIMKSFEEPDNENIRAYMEAAESDPDKVGNADIKVR